MEDQYIGNYRVLKKIGAGGMASVYLAVHRDVPNLRVILKILSDPRLAERFKQEADKLALLDGHPAICRIKHFFNHGDDTVIAMEYIDGVTVEEKIAQAGILPLKESLRIICSVLDILEFAHQKGISHRDIKPSNIMVDKSGQVKVIDFGIAKAESDPNLTIAGTACGTPAYMAPEQFTPTEHTNYTLVDVYAAGTTLYYMLTGSLPYKADNEFAMRDAKLFSEPVKPRSVNPGIPKQVEDVILRSISKEPEKRYQSTQQMRDVLQDIEKSCDTAEEVTQAVVKTGEQDVPKKPKKEKKPSGKSPLLKVIPIVLVLAIVAFGIYKFVLSPGEPEPSPHAMLLIAPTNGTVLSDTRTPTLSWEAGAGPGGSYILEYADNSDFVDSKTIAGITSDNYTFTSDLENGSYFWRVYPVAGDGSRGEHSGSFEFAVDVASSTPTTPTTPPVMRHIPEGQFALSINPSGDVYLNDKLLGRNQKTASTTLDTGTYVVRVENRQSTEKVKYDTIHVANQGTVRRDYSFTIPPPAPKERLGEVRIGSKPRGADIIIDGELQKQQTNFTFQLKPGVHIVTASIAFGDVERTLVDTVSVAADSTYKLLFDFEQQSF